MRWILDLLFAKRIEQHTERYLQELIQAPTQTSKSNVTELIKALENSPGPRVLLGETLSGEKISLPASEIVGSHSMIQGSTGSGKTFFALACFDQLIALLPRARIGCAVLDPKWETFGGGLLLLKRRLDQLRDVEAQELRRRVVVIDFSLANPLSLYNIIARWPNADPDFFAGNRADLLLDLLPGGDGLSLGASALLRKAILLLSEFGLPIGWLDGLLFDDALRGKLLARSADRNVVAYFIRQFPKVPPQTIAALSRRMEALFSSEALRCALSGQTAPDFRALQDEGKIILTNCAGPNLSRGVRQLLQALVISDFCQAVFARQQRDSLCLLIADEAQNFFSTERLRGTMSDFLCTSRSFGTHAMFLTQSIGSAIQDASVANALQTNTRWNFTMRGEPSGATYLKGALPVTGRKLRPQTNPFDEPSFYSLSEERSLVLDSIASLPDRTGFFWAKSRSREAFLIRTANIDIPEASALEREIEVLRGDPSFGMRQSKQDYDRMTEQREREWNSESPRAVNTTLANAYRRSRMEGQ
jgi:hypothetical protein